MSQRRPFEDRDLAREAGRRGAAAKIAADKLRRGDVAPYSGTFQDFLTDAGFVGPSWVAWRTFWKVVDALPLDEAELELFRLHTGRTTPPAEPVREAWDVVGRRGGKTRSKAARALWTGIRRNWLEVLAPGERAVIPLIAADRRQARQALGYIKGLLQLPAFAPFARRALKEAVELATGVTLEVHTASFKTTRGYTCPLVLGDEVSFWASDDGSASPDAEVLQALRPTMSTIADALLSAGSTPYAKRGAVWSTFERYYGRDDADVLVWRAASRDMNPSLGESVVARAYEDDPVAAAAEYGAEFRRDIAALLDREAVDAVTFAGRRELPPRRDVEHVAFVDPSGGSQDSMTLAIAHAEGEVAVLDAVRERRPPFAPDEVVEEFAELVRAYGLGDVAGDRYAGEWPREAFHRQGVEYVTAKLSKSELYRALVPKINSGLVELLDDRVLKAQLIGLERRVARGGRDSIDHPPGGKDDVANAAAGALVLAAVLEQEPPFIFGNSSVGWVVEGRGVVPSLDAPKEPSGIDVTARRTGSWFPGDMTDAPEGLGRHRPPRPPEEPEPLTPSRSDSVKDPDEDRDDDRDDGDRRDDADHDGEADDE